MGPPFFLSFLPLTIWHNGLWILRVHWHGYRLVTSVDAGGKRPQRPNRPDPKTVYSVPVDGDAYDGPKLAKVTIVEASDFA